jgi:hypothetical protein
LAVARDQSAGVKFRIIGMGTDYEYSRRVGHGAIRESSHAFVPLLRPGRSTLNPQAALLAWPKQ